MSALAVEVRCQLRGLFEQRPAKGETLLFLDARIDRQAVYVVNASHLTAQTQNRFPLICMELLLVLVIQARPPGRHFIVKVEEVNLR